MYLEVSSCLLPSAEYEHLLLFAIDRGGAFPGVVYVARDHDIDTVFVQGPQRVLEELYRAMWQQQCERAA